MRLFFMHFKIRRPVLWQNSDFVVAHWCLNTQSCLTPGEKRRWSSGSKHTCQHTGQVKLPGQKYSLFQWAEEVCPSVRLSWERSLNELKSQIWMSLSGVLCYVRQSVAWEVWDRRWLSDPASAAAARPAAPRRDESLMLKAGENRHRVSTPPSPFAVAGVIKTGDFVSKVVLLFLQQHGCAQTFPGEKPKARMNPSEAPAASPRRVSQGWQPEGLAGAARGVNGPCPLHGQTGGAPSTDLGSPRRGLWAASLPTLLGVRARAAQRLPWPGAGARSPPWVPSGWSGGARSGGAEMLWLAAPRGSDRARLSARATRRGALGAVRLAAALVSQLCFPVLRWNLSRNEIAARRRWASNPTPCLPQADLNRLAPGPGRPVACTGGRGSAPRGRGRSPSRHRAELRGCSTGGLWTRHPGRCCLACGGGEAPWDPFSVLKKMWILTDHPVKSRQISWKGVLTLCGGLCSHTHPVAFLWIIPLI